MKKAFYNLITEILVDKLHFPTICILVPLTNYTLKNKPLVLLSLRIFKKVVNETKSFYQIEMKY